MSQKSAQFGVIKDIVTAVSICILVFTLTAYLPLIGFFIAMGLPLPIVYYRLKLGRTIGILIMLAAFVIMTAVSGGLSIDMLFFGSLLATGLFLGETTENLMSPTRTVLTTCLAAAGVSVLLFLLYALSAGQGPLSLLNDYAAANLRMSLDLYQGLGVPKESIETIRASSETIQAIMVRLLPSVILSLLMVVAWINLLGIKSLLRRKGLNLKHLEHLNCWRAPEKLVWPVIACILMFFVPSRMLNLTGLNVAIVILPVYFFQGIAVVSFYFEKKRFPKALRLFIYSIITVQQVFLLLVVGLGFFDTWFNFRRLDIARDTDD